MARACRNSLCPAGTSRSAGTSGSLAWAFRPGEGMARQTPATTMRYGVHQRRERLRDVRALWRVIKFPLSNSNPSFPGRPRFLGSTVLPERPLVNRKARRRYGGSNVNDGGRPMGSPGFLRQALPTSGAWFSPRRWTLRSSLWPGRHGRASQPVDATQDLGEQKLWLALCHMITAIGLADAGFVLKSRNRPSH